MATPSHVDLSVLWVPIMPETSKMDSAMQDAGKQAKESFAKSTKDIAKPIEEAIDQAGKNASKSMEQAGKESGDTFANQLAQAIDKRDWSDLHKELTFTTILAAKEASDGIVNAFDKAHDKISKVGDKIKGLGASSKTMGDKFRGAAKELDKVPAALDKAKSAVDGVGGAAKLAGIDIGGWSSPLNDATKLLDESEGHVRNVASIFSSLPGKVGAFGAALTELAGPLSIIAAAPLGFIKVMDYLKDHQPGADVPNLDYPGQGIAQDADKNPNQKAQDLGGLLGVTPPGAPSTPPGAPPLNSVHTRQPGRPANPYRQFYPNAFADAPAPDDAPDLSAGGGRSSRAGGGRVGGSGLRSQVTGGVSDRRSLRAAGGRIGNLLAFAQSLEGTPYSTALRNDCSGMIAELANVAVGLPPPDSAHRFSTPTEGPALAQLGFLPGLGGPNDFNIGWNPAPGMAGHTAGTLPGGINVEQGGSSDVFKLGGSTGADSSQFTMHAHLPMGGRGGSAGGRTIPTGAEHDPIYVTRASSGSGGNESGSPFESQGQQLGQGLINGVLQMFGLDGSVFGGKSPLDFGAVKLGGGITNSLLHMFMPGGGSGGGGLPGLGMIPGAAAISAATRPGGGSIGLSHNPAAGLGGGVTNIHHDNSINIHDPMTPSGWVTPAQFAQNSSLPNNSGTRYNTSPLPVGQY